MSIPLTAIELVHKAIAAGIFGQIEWNDEAYERARIDPELQSVAPQAIRRLLHSHVLSGGRLDERRENRTDWLEANADRPSHYRDFWYRAVIEVPGLFPKGLFIEIRLLNDDPADPWVQIVNALPQP